MVDDDTAIQRVALFAHKVYLALAEALYVHDIDINPYDDHVYLTMHPLHNSKITMLVPFPSDVAEWDRVAVLMYNWLPPIARIHASSSRKSLVSNRSDLSFSESHILLTIISGKADYSRTREHTMKINYQRRPVIKSPRYGDPLPTENEKHHTICKIRMINSDTNYILDVSGAQYGLQDLVSRTTIFEHNIRNTLPPNPDGGFGTCRHLCFNVLEEDTDRNWAGIFVPLIKQVDALVDTFDHKRIPLRGCLDMDAETWNDASDSFVKLVKTTFAALIDAQRGPHGSGRPMYEDKVSHRTMLHTRPMASCRCGP